MPETITALGPTGSCLTGRHDRCSYRPAGACHGGIVLRGGGRYTCPCECHAKDDTR